MSSLDWSLSASEVPERGLDVVRSATADERAALARELDILGLERVDLKARIVAARGGGWRLDGRLRVAAEQACVVTLEPVPERLEITLAIDLVPQETLPAAGESIDDPLAERIPEPIVNGRIDLGAIVFQEIAAALDPFPRRADAGLERSEAGNEDPATASPFAKLRDLATRKREP